MRKYRLAACVVAFGLALAGAAGTAMAAPKKVVLLINGTVGDKSFFDSAANGMALIKQKYGDAVTTKTIEMSYDETKWQPTVEDISAQDWDMIIVGTYQMIDIVTQVAPEHPNRNYVVFDGAPDGNPATYKNVYWITFKQNEGSYLAGMVGASLIKQNLLPGSKGSYLGFLGGMDIPNINDFLVGYVAGSEAVIPTEKTAISYIGSFSDAAKGKELALSQYNTGVAIGFNVAGQAGLGQLSAAKDVKRYAIGVDSDQAAIFEKTDPEMAGRVVTSVLKRVDVSLLRAVDLLQAGKLPVGQVESLGLKDGAVGIADNNIYQKLVPAALRQQVATAATDIAAGKIVVPTALGMPTDQVDALRAKVRP